MYFVVLNCPQKKKLSNSQKISFRLPRSALKKLPMNEIDYAQVIENESELEYYKKIHQKIITFLSYNNSVTFWDIVRVVGGSDRRVLRLVKQMQLNNEITLNTRSKIISLINKSRE